ncbi:MAG: hypothetical protein WC565_03025 [Parcubacteria group bacterium]
MSEALMEMMAPQGGYAAPAPEPAAPPQSQGMSAEDHLKVGIEHLQAALQMEPDDQDSQALAGTVQRLYAILAGRQKEQDGAMAGKLSPRMMRRGV